MITAEMIMRAQQDLIEFWGEYRGKAIIAECAKVTPFNNDSKAFLEHCTACGGNWGGMLLTGIKKLYPRVWEVIPEDMGCFAWQALCATLILCGVDTSE